MVRAPAVAILNSTQTAQLLKGEDAGFEGSDGSSTLRSTSRECGRGSYGRVPRVTQCILKVWGMGSAHEELSVVGVRPKYMTRKILLKEVSENATPRKVVDVWGFFSLWWSTFESLQGTELTGISRESACFCCPLVRVGAWRGGGVKQNLSWADLEVSPVGVQVQPVFGSPTSWVYPQQQAKYQFCSQLVIREVEDSGVLPPQQERKLWPTPWTQGNCTDWNHHWRLERCREGLPIHLHQTLHCNGSKERWVMESRTVMTTEAAALDEVSLLGKLKIVQKHLTCSYWLPFTTSWYPTLCSLCHIPALYLSKGRRYDISQHTRNCSSFFLEDPDCNLVSFPSILKNCCWHFLYMAGLLAKNSLSSSENVSVSLHFWRVVLLELFPDLHLQVVAPTRGSACLGLHSSYSGLLLPGNICHYNYFCHNQYQPMYLFDEMIQCFLK